MRHDGPHYLPGLSFLFGSGTLGGVTAQLARVGWTPESVCTLIGALTAFVMAVVSLSRELRAWSDRKEGATAAIVAASLAAGRAAADRWAAENAKATNVPPELDTPAATPAAGR